MVPNPRDLLPYMFLLCMLAPSLYMLANLTAPLPSAPPLFDLVLFASFPISCADMRSLYFPHAPTPHTHVIPVLLCHCCDIHVPHFFCRSPLPSSCHRTNSTFPLTNSKFNYGATTISSPSHSSPPLSVCIHSGGLVGVRGSAESVSSNSVGSHA